MTIFILSLTDFYQHFLNHPLSSFLNSGAKFLFWDTDKYIFKSIPEFPLGYIKLSQFNRSTTNELMGFSHKPNYLPVSTFTIWQNLPFIRKARNLSVITDTSSSLTILLFIASSSLGPIDFYILKFSNIFYFSSSPPSQPPLPQLPSPPPATFYFNVSSSLTFWLALSHLPTCSPLSR